MTFFWWLLREHRTRAQGCTFHITTGVTIISREAHNIVLQQQMLKQQEQKQNQVKQQTTYKHKMFIYIKRHFIHPTRIKSQWTQIVLQLVFDLTVQCIFHCSYTWESIPLNQLESQSQCFTEAKICTVVVLISPYLYPYPWPCLTILQLTTLPSFLWSSHGT